MAPKQVAMFFALYSRPLTRTETFWRRVNGGRAALIMQLTCNDLWWLWKMLPVASSAILLTPDVFFSFLWCIVGLEIFLYCQFMQFTADLEVNCPILQSLPNCQFLFQTFSWINLDSGFWIPFFCQWLFQSLCPVKEFLSDCYCCTKIKEPDTLNSKCVSVPFRSLLLLVTMSTLY